MKQGKILFIDDKPEEGNYLGVIQKALPRYDILMREKRQGGTYTIEDG